MKNLYVKNEKHVEEIQKKLNEVFGKIEYVVTIQDIQKSIKEPFCKRLMKGAMMRIEAHCNLPKAYKYKKEVGGVYLKHNGKEWTFAWAYRTVCWSGGSTGGTNIAFVKENKEEIVSNLLKFNNYSF